MFVLTGHSFIFLVQKGEWSQNLPAQKVPWLVIADFHMALPSFSFNWLRFVLILFLILFLFSINTLVPKTINDSKVFIGVYEQKDKKNSISITIVHRYHQDHQIVMKRQYSHSSILKRFILMGTLIHTLLKPLNPHLNPLDFISSISNPYKRMIHASSESESCGLYLEQYGLFCAISVPKLLRISLQLAQEHAIYIHSKVVLSMWLRYERIEDKLVGICDMDYISKVFKCLNSALVDIRPEYHM